MRNITLVLAAWIVAAGALAPAPARAVTISGTFHLREHAGPNDLGFPPGDRHLIGATSITPSGPPTTATATQAGLTVTLDFVPQTVSPAQHFVSLPFDSTRTGRWTITATRELETATALTNAIPTPALLPLAENVRVLGIGVTPTVVWDLPDLAGFGVDRIRVTIFDAVSRDRLAQLLVPPRFSPTGPILPIAFTLPAGVLQYGRTYVFRVQLEDLVPVTGILQNRSSAYSSAYTPATVVAGSGFTLQSQRTSFEAELGEVVVDDYSHPGYDVNSQPDPTQPDVLSDAAMSAVLGETDYVTTQWSNSNVIVRFPEPSDPAYCAGCNGSYRLDFTSTSVGNASGIFGVGFDVERIIHSFAFPEHPWAFVTFADGSTASLPLSQGFWGMTAGRRIRSIHVGLADGIPSGIIYIEIDNLTIGSARAIGVTVDIKPGSFPNSINLGAKGTVPVAILSTPEFDARQVDPATVTVGGAAVKRKPHGGLMASAEDVDGDGLLDLVLHVPTAALELGLTDTEAVLEGVMFDGTAIHGTDSVRIVR